MQRTAGIRSTGEARGHPTGPAWSRAGVRLKMPTRRMIRQHCSECLCLSDNKCYGFDCQIETCHLYECMPWRGVPMPARLRGEEV